MLSGLRGGRGSGRGRAPGAAGRRRRLPSWRRRPAKLVDLFKRILTCKKRVRYSREPLLGGLGVLSEGGQLAHPLRLRVCVHAGLLFKERSE